MRRVSESVLKGDHGCKAGDAGAIAAALSVSGRFRVMGGSSAWTADAITQITITVAAVLLWAIISSCNGIGDEQPDIHIRTDRPRRPCFSYVQKTGKSAH